MKIILIPNNPIMAARHYRLANTLIDKGHEVHYFTWALPYRVSAGELIKHLATSLIPKRYQHERVTVYQVSRLPYFWPVINGWLFKAQLRRLYRTLGADLIITESFTNETEVPKDLPFIYDLADDYAAPANVYGSPLYKLAFRLLGIRNVMRRQCQNALAVTAVSEVLCAYARQYNDLVCKLPNGVDTDTITQILADKTTYPTNPHSLVYVTRFGNWSRAIETLEATVALKQEFPGLELTLVGDGSESARMLRFIADHHAESYIHYKGFVYDRTELYSLMNQCAIGLNISDKNAWRDAAHPIKVVEYSALGKKVVSTNLSEVAALGTPNIFMFDDTPERSLVAVLRQALQAPLTARSYTAVSKAMLKTYDWDVLTDQLLDCIAKATQPRIVHATPSYPPSLGGMEKVVRLLASIQARRGLRTSVVTSWLSQGDSGSDVPTTYLPTRIFANTRIMPGLFAALLRLKRTDTVHLHFTSAYMPEVVWLASKIRGFTYIVHMHVDFGPTGRFGFLLALYKPWVLKYVLRAARYVAVFTPDQKTAIHRQYGVSPARIAVIPNGVEAQFYHTAPRALPANPRLLFVGRFAEQKNLPLLLQSLEGISEQFQTTLVGEGALLPDLQALVRQLKLSNITFAGRADGEALLHHYRNADIFVLPSHYEGMPLVLLEAMAMGLPVVATDVTGSRDVVTDGKTGLLVPAGDADALRAALLKLKANPAVYQQLSSAAVRHAKQYSWDNVSARFEALYKDGNA